MPITIKNNQLSKEVFDALDNIMEVEMDGTPAIKLTRIVKELNSLISDKEKIEKRTLDKWAKKNEEGDIIKLGDVVELTNKAEYESNMKSIGDMSNEIQFDKLKYEELNLKTARVKDLIKLDFIFD